jgi:hypothetical protein
MTGQHLDLTTPSPTPPGVVPGRASDGSRFLGLHFACCDAYSRIYPNREQTAYVGRCPRCGGRVEILIGPGGSDARFFMAQ